MAAHPRRLLTRWRCRGSGWPRAGLAEQIARKNEHITPEMAEKPAGDLATPFQALAALPSPKAGEPACESPTRCKRHAACGGRLLLAMEDGPERYGASSRFDTILSSSSCVSISIPS